MLGQEVEHDVVPYFFSDLADWASLEYVGPAASWDREIVRGSTGGGRLQRLVPGGRARRGRAVGGALRRPRACAAADRAPGRAGLTSRNAAGMPTTADRPTTTASRPSISMPERRRISTAACGGRGQEPVVAETEESRVERVDPVDVLGRVDRVDDLAQPDRRRQRHLDDDTVDLGVVVDLPDVSRTAALGRLAVELDEAGLDPDLRAAAEDLLEIDRRRSVRRRSRRPGQADGPVSR